MSASGQHVALDVYADRWAPVDVPTYLTHLDEAYEAMADLVGGVPYGGELITVREEASMAYGMLAGNPVLVNPDIGLALAIQQGGMDFGVPHELGHDFDLAPGWQYYFGSTPYASPEQWANLKLVYAFDVLGARYPHLTVDQFWQIIPLGQMGQRFVDLHARPWIDNHRTDYQNMPGDTYTGLLYTIVQRVGWEPFKGVFREFNQAHLPVPVSEEAKVELLANLLSRHAGVDLIPTFQSWGFPVKRFADESRTAYVDDNGTANATGSGQCGRPNYATIQAAVDDRSATRVIVCPGTYAEQVVVGRSVSLEGRSGAIIQAPGVPSSLHAVVVFAGSQQSLLQGFIITGASVSGAPLTGVDVRDGAEVTITRSHIHDTDASIYVARGGQAVISRNTLEPYGQGILLFDSRTFATISDNSIKGLSSSLIGIDVREGASAAIEGNTISGNADTSGDGIGIVVDLTAHVMIRSNEVRDNDRGIVIGDEVGDVEIRSNKVHDNTSHGLEIIEDEDNAASENLVVKNEFTHNGGDGIAVHGQQQPDAHNIFDSNKASNNSGNGISFGLGAVGNTLKNNEVIKNGGFDIIDANGGPPANIYVDNKCTISNPDGLCKD